MEIDITEEIKSLIAKANKTHLADEALKFSQAALNLTYVYTAIAVYTHR